MAPAAVSYVKHIPFTSVEVSCLSKIGLEPSLSGEGKMQKWLTYSAPVTLHLRLASPHLLSSLVIDNIDTSHVTVRLILDERSHGKSRPVTVRSKLRLPHERVNTLAVGHLPCTAVEIVCHSGNPVSVRSVSAMGIPLESLQERVIPPNICDLLFDSPADILFSHDDAQEGARSQYPRSPSPRSTRRRLQSPRHYRRTNPPPESTSPAHSKAATWSVLAQTDEHSHPQVSPGKQGKKKNMRPSIARPGRAGTSSPGNAPPHEAEAGGVREARQGHKIGFLDQVREKQVEETQRQGTRRRQAGGPTRQGQGRGLSRSRSTL